MTSLTEKELKDFINKNIEKTGEIDTHKIQKYCEDNFPELWKSSLDLRVFVLMM